MLQSVTCGITVRCMRGRKPRQLCRVPSNSLGIAGSLMPRPYSQLQRASLSVQLNIAEGYAFGQSPTYLHHLRIAYGSAVETGELLETALKAKVIPVEPATHLLARNRRSQRLLLGML